MTETMFETVFSAMGEGVVIQNGNADITVVNPAAERMLGLAAAELIGRSSSVVASAVKLIHEDGSKCSWDNHLSVSASRAGQPLRDAVLGIVRPDGTLVWLAVNTQPLLSDGATAPYSVAVIFRDITERKRMEGALADRERELCALAESSPGMMGSFYLRSDGSVCMPYVSANIRELFGLTPQAVAVDAAPLLALQHPDDAQMVLDSIAESARTLTTWHVEYRILHPAKGVRWMESHTNPQPHPDGGVIWYGYVHDITERKHAEALLVQREREFRSLSENLPDNIVRYNREGVTVYVNPALERTLGDLATAMIGTTPREFHPNGAYEDYAQLLDVVLASGEAGELEKTLHAPDGRTFIHQIRMVPERGENGEVIGVLAIGRDITGRKQAERELRAHARSLECMGRVNQAIQGTVDLDQMMRDVLDVVLVSLDCDRAFLLYPCDPDVDEWQVPMERTRPEYPGALALGITAIPMDSEAAKTMRITRDASGPVMFGSGAEYSLPPISSENFGFKSEMLIAVHPKLGKPWVFGIHQCAQAKVWTENEADLFQKIGWRLSDALTSVLMYRDLRASERQFRTLAENFPDILIRYDREGRRTYVNPAMERIFTVTAKQAIGLSPQEANPVELPEIYLQALERTLATGERSEFEMELPLSSGDVRTGFIYIVAEWAVDGRISGAITIGRDITRLKQTERQLRELAAHLQSAREEEKAHLARELHDDLGQILFLLKLKLSGYANDCAANSGAICGYLQEAQILTDRAIGTARNIVSALRPPALDYGVAAALKWLVENFVSNMNIQCELKIEDEEIRLDEGKSLALFRIVQEALNNVAKHAQADRVEIVLNKDATDCALSIRDNGTGFDTSKKKKGSFGLVGMHERALMHGGTVSIESRVGGGTEIVVRIPAD